MHACQPASRAWTKSLKHSHYAIKIKSIRHYHTKNPLDTLTVLPSNSYRMMQGCTSLEQAKQNWISSSISHAITNNLKKIVTDHVQQDSSSTRSDRWIKKNPKNTLPEKLQLWWNLNTTCQGRGREDITNENQTHLSMHAAMRRGMPTPRISLNILPISVV